MDVLRVSEADNDKQEIDRITLTVANFSLDIVVGSFEDCCRAKFSEQVSSASP
jgi:RNA-binding protein YlmH